MQSATSTILLTFARLNIGGAERRTLELLRHLRQWGVDARFLIYVVTGKEGTLDAAFEEAGAELIRGKLGLRGLPNFAAVCRERQVDVAHINATLGSGFYCMAARLAGVPRRIAHLRSAGYDVDSTWMDLRNGLYAALTHTFSTDIVGVCDAGRELARASPDRWRTLYNGVEIESLEQLRTRRRPEHYDGRAFNLAVVGRVWRGKNLGKAIDTLHALETNGPGRPFRLHVVGPDVDGETARLRERCRRLGIENRVFFHGPADEPLDHFFASDLLLLPSLREGLPGTVLEALSCGTPVVAADLPGVAEIARLTPGVRRLSTDAADGLWARAVLESLARADRQAIQDGFARSPFTLDNHARKMMALWGLEPAA